MGTGDPSPCNPAASNAVCVVGLPSPSLVSSLTIAYLVGEGGASGVVASVVPVVAAGSSSGAGATVDILLGWCKGRSGSIKNCFLDICLLRMRKRQRREGRWKSCIVWFGMKTVVDASLWNKKALPCSMCWVNLWGQQQHHFGRF